MVAISRITITLRRFSFSLLRCQRDTATPRCHYAPLPCFFRAATLSMPTLFFFRLFFAILYAPYAARQQATCRDCFSYAAASPIHIRSINEYGCVTSEDNNKHVKQEIPCWLRLMMLAAPPLPMLNFRCAVMRHAFRLRVITPPLHAPGAACCASATVDEREAR